LDYLYQRGRQPGLSHKIFAYFLTDRHDAMTETSQHSELPSGLGWHEGMTVVLHMDETGTREACRRCRVDELTEMMGLDDVHALAREGPVETIE
jgi:hypothetical protein